MGARAGSERRLTESKRSTERRLPTSVVPVDPLMARHREVWRASVRCMWNLSARARPDPPAPWVADDPSLARPSSRGHGRVECGRAPDPERLHRQRRKAFFLVRDRPLLHGATFFPCLALKSRCQATNAPSLSMTASPET